MKFIFDNDGMVIDFFYEAHPIYRLIQNRSGHVLVGKNKQRPSRYGRKVYAGIDLHKSKGIAYTEIHRKDYDHVKLIIGFGKSPDQEPVNHWRQRSVRSQFRLGPFYFCKFVITRFKDFIPDSPASEKPFSREDWNREVDEWLDHVYVRIQQVYDSNPSMD